MKSALRRQLEITGWQIVGFGLGALAFIVGAVLWGHTLESEVGNIAKRQHSDHRHIVAIESGHPLGGDANSTPSPGHSQPGPPPSGPPTEHNTPQPQAPPVSESANHGVVESVGPTVGETVSGATETVCSTTAAINVSCP